MCKFQTKKLIRIIAFKSSETKKQIGYNSRCRKGHVSVFFFYYWNGHFGRHTCIITLIIIYRQVFFRIQTLFLTVFTKSPEFLQ